MNLYSAMPLSFVRCWLCGNRVDLSALNLMATYERYLILTFILSFLIRFRQYQTNVQFAWQFPQQWPSVLQVIKEHRSIFLRWTTLLPVAITLGILLTHTICYRLIWSEATVTPKDLSYYTGVLIFVLPVSLWMIILDLKTLFSTSQLNFAEIERNLEKGEFALTSRAMSAVRFATFGMFNPRKYVENRVADSLHGVRLALIAQLRRWSFHTAVRITFGFLLWFGYARITNTISQLTFLGYVALLAIWLLTATWWSRHKAEELVDQVEAPSG